MTNTFSQNSQNSTKCWKLHFCIRKWACEWLPHTYKLMQALMVSDSYTRNTNHDIVRWVEVVCLIRFQGSGQVSEWSLSLHFSPCFCNVLSICVHCYTYMCSISTKSASHIHPLSLIYNSPISKHSFFLTKWLGDIDLIHT